MSEYAGSAMSLDWIYSGGTVGLEADYRTFNWAPTLNYIDATAGQDTFEVLLDSFGTGPEITCTLVAQADGTALLTALARQTAGSLVYGPEGTATGKTKYTIPATSAGPQWSQVFNDVTEITAQWRQTSVEAGTVF